MRRPLGHNYSQKNQMFSRAHEDKNVSTVMLFLLFKCCFEDRSVVQTILIFYFSITKLKLIVQKLTCACVMNPTLNPGLLFLVRNRVTLEGSVAESILLVLKAMKTTKSKITGPD